MRECLKSALGLLILTAWALVPLKAFTVGGVPWGVVAAWGAATAAAIAWGRRG